MRQWIPVEQIDVSSKQIRRVARSKVEKHCQAFEHGEEILPIDVIAYWTQGDMIRYRILGNGRHRYLGAIEAGMPVIECFVHEAE
ncbi:MAG: hypothetical protein UU08_C0022G0003 [Candidatus Uhrbacteria bacterium GW2011_GWE2_40_58]|nr:MAG: hypothetical protein UT94_C0027G0003 [Candidatus Uhrbacteria bacterium GW2011_GWF2_40_263]KKR67252.1 MAG: hypothetical protein UU08_C0022G0003 [Candidatus Uhrbacteria bacterium GW2011_GWE2_40_58]OGL93027.1 MAG: hypothetical protein A2239_00930 [Candidatus Uhrbacteria bacterium RIFOXYA2_FULL_40_9]OGL97772.1 MAG: hypothetical protein A2332_02370 [Candidatus Uhrbacteria bacterium RIFOXYB2_FULL_41_18]HBK34967.1 hypothetical protein [Candidatus Uhrbacteria bacterium]